CPFGNGTNDLVVLFGDGSLPGEPCDDRAVRKGQLALAKGLRGDGVAEFSAHVVLSAADAGDGDQGPIAVAGGQCDAEDRRGLSFGLFAGGRRGGSRSGEDDERDDDRNDPSHAAPPRTFLTIECQTARTRSLARSRATTSKRRCRLSSRQHWRNSGC